MFSAAIDVQGGDILGYSLPGSLANCLRRAAGGEVTNFGAQTSEPGVGDTISVRFTEPGSSLNAEATLVPTAPLNA